MKKTYLYILFILATAHLVAQPPIPGKPQTKAIALVGGMAHLGNGQVIGNAVILFENGKITEVREAASANFDQSKADIIDISGKHVYPGLIAPNSIIGLEEIQAVRSTRDYVETGGMNPNVRALIAYNTDSELIPTTRSNGVLLAQAVPQGGIIAGTSSIMQLDAWNWEDAAYRKDDGIHVNWPAMFTQGNFFEPSPIKKNENRGKVLDELSRTFKDAQGYAQIKNPSPVNLKLESMRGLYDGSKTLFIHVDYSKSIIEAVQFAKNNGVKKVVVVGGDDAWMVTDFLKENNVAVLLNALHRLPTRIEEDVDMPFKQPSILKNAGILVGLTYEGQPMQSRNLPFMAGQAAGHGLTKEEALTMVTANTAKILGIDAKTGTIEVGKEANLVVSSGDLLDMRTNNVEYAFIQGRQIVLDDKHKRLYKRFSAKYAK